MAELYLMKGIPESTKGRKMTIVYRKKATGVNLSPNHVQFGFVSPSFLISLWVEQLCQKLVFISKASRHHQPVTHMIEKRRTKPIANLNGSPDQTSELL